MEKFPNQPDKRGNAEGSEEAAETRIHPKLVSLYADFDRAIKREKEALRDGKTKEAIFYGEQRERLQSLLAYRKPLEPPIKQGEIFDPEAELRTIRKYPASLRDLAHEDLREYREKLAFQRQGFGKTQEEMLKFIRENPDAAKEELLREVEFMAEHFGFSATQRQAMGEVLDIYLTRRQAIRALRERYTDPKKLYTAVFGREPKGIVEVEDGPMTLYFRCFDPYDYAWIYNRKMPPITGEADPALKEEEFAVASSTWGAHSPSGFMVPDLAGAIAAENASSVKIAAYGAAQENLEKHFGKPLNNFSLSESQEFIRSAEETEEKYSASIFNHEEQHAIKKLFTAALGKQVPSGPPKDYGDKTELEKFRTLLKDRRRVHAEENIKDEILAYMREGASSVDVIKNLMKVKGEGGVYDYLADVRDQYFEGLRKRRDKDEITREAYGAFIDELFDVFFEAYGELIKDGLNVYAELKEAGYSHNEITGMLIEEPLAKWPKVAERLLGKKKKDTTLEAPLPPAGG